MASEYCFALVNVLSQENEFYCVKDAGLVGAVMDFFYALGDYQNFVFAFVMFLLFVHGVRVGQHFWGSHVNNG